MPLWLLFVLVLLATHRITRLLVDDKLPLVDLPRRWLINHFGRFDHEGNLTGGRRWGRLGWSIAYLWTCPWCMSVWVAAGLVFTAGAFTSIPLPWLWIAAASTVTGFLSGVVESEHELRYELAELEVARRKTGR